MTNDKRLDQATATAIEIQRKGDLGYAQILAKITEGNFRYAIHRGRWMMYNNAYWQEIADQQMALAASNLLFKHFYIAGNNATDDNIRSQCVKEMYAVCRTANVKQILYMYAGWPGVATRSEEWDRDPWTLNVLNGTLDLKTCQLRPHNKDDLLTKIAPVVYDPNADCPRWRAHIELVLPDPDVRRQVQRDLGKALVGAVLDESLPIWYGEGANGKTTTYRVIMSLLGDYARRAAPDLLIQTKHDRHPTEIADLVGSRVVFSVEVDQAKKLAEALVKDLTGGDRKKARFMRQDFFEFEQTFSIFLVCNHKPIITGSDHAIWRRIKLVPWTVTIPPEARRPQDQVIEELMSEASGILNWLIEGLMDWQRDMLWVAEAVKAATEAYRAEQDVLRPFIDECCRLCPHCTVSVKELYEAYISWTAKAGEIPVDKRQFSRSLEARGISKRRGNYGIWHYQGITLIRNDTNFPDKPIRSEHLDNVENTYHYVSSSPASDSSGEPDTRFEPAPATEAHKSVFDQEIEIDLQYVQQDDAGGDFTTCINIPEKSAALQNRDASTSSSETSDKSAAKLMINDTRNQHQEALEELSDLHKFLYKLLGERGRASASELARATGHGIKQVRKALQELQERDLVIRERSSEPYGPDTWRVNAL